MNDRVHESNVGPSLVDVPLSERRWYDHKARPNNRSTQPTFFIWRQLRTCAHISHRRRRGQCATVHALQESLRSKLAQIASDGVFGNIQLFAEGLGDELTIPLEAAEDELLAFRGEHRVRWQIL